MVELPFLVVVNLFFTCFSPFCFCFCFFLTEPFFYVTVLNPVMKFLDQLNNVEGFFQSLCFQLVIKVINLITSDYPRFSFPVSLILFSYSSIICLQRPTIMKLDLHLCVIYPNKHPRYWISIIALSAALRHSSGISRFAVIDCKTGRCQLPFL